MPHIHAPAATVLWACIEELLQGLSIGRAYVKAGPSPAGWSFLAARCGQIFSTRMAIPEQLFRFCLCSPRARSGRKEIGSVKLVPRSNIITRRRGPRSHYLTSVEVASFILHPPAVNILYIRPVWAEQDRQAAGWEVPEVFAQGLRQLGYEPQKKITPSSHLLWWKQCLRAKMSIRSWSFSLASYLLAQRAAIIEESRSEPHKRIW